jgi:hypothetical protein
MQIPEVCGGRPVTAVTLQDPGSGVIISVRPARTTPPKSWTQIIPQIDLSKCIVTAIELAASEVGGAEGLLDPTPVELRRGLIESYRQRNRCSLKEIAARANVTPRALRGWRSGELPDGSLKSIRIEALLQRGLRSD